MLLLTSEKVIFVVINLENVKCKKDRFQFLVSKINKILSVGLPCWQYLTMVKAVIWRKEPARIDFNFSFY